MNNRVELEGDVAQLTYELGLRDREITQLKEKERTLMKEVTILRAENKSLKEDFQNWQQLPMSPVSLASEELQTTEDKQAMVQLALEREILALKNESNILSSWIRTLMTETSTNDCD